MESIAVKIPTSAVIPTAIIKTVRIVLNKLLLIDCNAILIFSANNVIFRIPADFPENLNSATILLFISDTIKQKITISPTMGKLHVPDEQMT